MELHRIIVTGASGPLGVVLIKECIRRGIEVAALVRPGSKKRDDIPKDELVHVYEVDLGKIADFSFEDNKPYDVLIHFGWMYTEGSGRYDALRQSENVTATLKTAEFAKRCGCNVFVGAGSQAEYGPQNKKLDETAETKPVVAYGIAKTAAYNLLKEYGRMNDMRINWIRIFSVYGPYENDYVFTSYVIRTLLEGKEPELTACEQKWDYLYCEDVVRAFLLVAEKAQGSGIYNLGAGQTCSLKEFVECIKDTIDPSLSLGIGKRPYSENQIMHLEADISKICKDTGFEPEISIQEGIKKTVEWYKSTI
ncbi:NAD(P)-dependent oxidoreductase [Butyrivibrio sp. INlla16]|uniref:NAD-dependent epimerase/dehydratase family protein n=1 Tax=Butyrivibrio sp. INlla16 TaxID=1520807 RepID=UPI0008866967|nr:NAD(P)-dependent oxidoreductase [Butyrivibrio sp. INlla16]SDB60225.1 Nucleoside-diphosphate-sugar epimerase [Butyrivibrio sp. INlla16]